MIDLFGGSVDLRVSQGGKWASIEQILGTGAHFISEVKIDIKIFSIFTMEVKIDAPLDEAVKLINSGSIGMGFTIQKGDSSKSSNGKQGSSVVFKKMAVRIHYGGISSPVFRGVMVAPEVTGSGDGISITLRAVGMLFESTQTSKVGNSLKGNAREVIEDLLNGKPGSQGRMVVINYRSNAREILEKTKIDEHFNGTNYDAAERIAKSSGCYMVYTGANDFGLIPQIDIIPIAKARSKIFTYDGKTATEFVAFKQIDPNKGIFPITSFDTSLASVVGPFSSRGGVRVSFDKDTKKTTESGIDNNSYSNPEGGGRNPENSTSDGSVPGSVGQDSESSETGSAFSRTSEAKSIFGVISDSLGISENSITQTFFDYFEKASRFELTTLGPPNLLPGQMIRVNIADISFLKGTYDVIGVSHSLGRSGFESSIECLRLFGFASQTDKVGKKIINKAKDAISGTKVSKKVN